MKTAGLCLLVLCFLAAPAARAQSYTNSNGLVYVITNSAIDVTGYTGTSPTLAIPDSIAGLPVTSIENIAFQGCQNLTNVVIPDSVTNIGGWAFSDTGLTGIAIGTNITAIGI